MANIIHKETLKVIRSVHTPDYMDGNWLINPILPKNVPQRYWKIVDGNVVPMSIAEKKVVDNALVATRQAERTRVLRGEKIRKEAIVIVTKALIRDGEMTEAEAVKAKNEAVFGGEISQIEVVAERVLGGL